MKRRLPLAKKAYRIAKSLQKKVEYKFFANATAPVQIDSIGTIWSLLYPSQGLGINARIGDSIKGAILTIKGAFSQYKPLVGTPTDEVVRLVILNDKENTVLTSADVFEYNGNAAAPFGSKVEDNKYDTKVLFDKTYNITETMPIQKFKLTIRFHKSVNFTTASNVIKNNSLKLLVLGQDVAIGAGSYFTFVSKCTYTDA